MCGRVLQVDAMHRRAAYERDQLLARIERRAANMEASFQRQRLMQVGSNLLTAQLLI